MIQVVRHKCCNKIFAACSEPHCYIDNDWLKELKKYVKQGCKVEMIDSGNWNFEQCNCSTDNQIELFKDN